MDLFYHLYFCQKLILVPYYLQLLEFKIYYFLYEFIITRWSPVNLNLYLRIIFFYLVLSKFKITRRTSWTTVSYFYLFSKGKNYFIKLKHGFKIIIIIHNKSFFYYLKYLRLMNNFITEINWWNISELNVLNALITMTLMNMPK
jgi:hypothetical protein